MMSCCEELAADRKCTDKALTNILNRELRDTFSQSRTSTPDAALFNKAIYQKWGDQVKVTIEA